MKEEGHVGYIIEYPISNLATTVYIQAIGLTSYDTHNNMKAMLCFIEKKSEY